MKTFFFSHVLELLDSLKPEFEHIKEHSINGKPGTSYHQ